MRPQSRSSLISWTRRACDPQKLRRAGIHPCNNVTKPNRILLILQADGVFGSHSQISCTSMALLSRNGHGVAADHYWLNGCRKDERFGGGVRYFDATSDCTRAIDLDALGMAYLPTTTRNDKAMYCNLRSICTNYAALGVTRFLLSRASLGSIASKRTEVCHSAVYQCARSSSLFLHLIVTVVRLARPGGLRSVVA